MEICKLIRAIKIKVGTIIIPQIYDNTIIYKIHAISDSDYIKQLMAVKVVFVFWKPNTKDKIDRSSICFQWNNDKSCVWQWMARLLTYQISHQRRSFQALNVQYADNDTSATFHLINQERGNKYDKEFVCQMSQLMMTKEFMNDRCNVAKWIRYTHDNLFFEDGWSICFARLRSLGINSVE